MLPLVSAVAGQPDVVRFFTVLAVALLAAKVAAAASERLGQPAVLGELLAGVLLGTGFLKMFPVAPDDPLTPVFRLLAAIGVVLLLFEIGLASDLRALARVSTGATAVALVGVTVPFLLGAWYWSSGLHPPEHSSATPFATAIFVGATLTATSVGITARVLGDLAVLHTLEARLILGAAVIDDVLGLALLGVVSGPAAGLPLTLRASARALGVAVAFLVLALGIGLRVAPRAFAVVQRMQARGVLSVAAFAAPLLLAALAARAGSALIVGAFAAGLILSETKDQLALIAARIKPVADLFTPIFFLSIGAAIDPHVWNPAVAENRPIWAIGGSLLAIAVAGKLASGWAVPWRRFNRAAVGVGMVPRGEVGLIFVQLGLLAGILSNRLGNAILFVVIATTLAGPPLLKWTLRRGATLDEAEPA
ncbi:MAG TPA: cation:proton antiporter [Gemmatimonadales bacterium]|nr:cation:proton antiporter [Gemmatimonadales bacterium]